MKFHPFHIVSFSPWPLFVSVGVMSLALNLLFFFFHSNPYFFVVSILSLVILMSLWWRDVVRESTFQGNHTLEVKSGIYLGVLLFILSEVMFFFSFFFAFFFISLVPDIELGQQWPPKGVVPLNLYQVPLLNTLILLSSGLAITWSHHSMIGMNKGQALAGGIVTVLLGVIFSLFQVEEYLEASFTMADSVFGSLFFIMTGFHGIHVMVGTIFIIIMMVRLNSNHFSPTQHLGFEASAWYWHFVDVVWLFLFISVYWWGS